MKTKRKVVPAYCWDGTKFKRKYYVERSAREEVEHWLRKQNIHYKVYQCPVCRNWHLTSK